MLEDRIGWSINQFKICCSFLFIGYYFCLLEFLLFIFSFNLIKLFDWYYYLFSFLILFLRVSCFDLIAIVSLFSVTLNCLRYKLSNCFIFFQCLYFCLYIGVLSSISAKFFFDLCKVLMYPYYSVKSCTLRAYISV